MPVAAAASHILKDADDFPDALKIRKTVIFNAGHSLKTKSVKALIFTDFVV